MCQTRFATTTAESTREGDLGPGEYGARPRPVFDIGKRCFDIVFSAAILLLTLPFSLLVTLAIWLESGGPILFRQQRVGKDGRLFWIYKFRSMYPETPKYAVTPTNDDRDPRVTRVGRLLRKSGLDELPQFWCVLRGDMSVVGPRPEMPFIVEAYSPRARRRLRVLPGITGPWQISTHRHEPIHENLQYDLYYLAHRSMILDVKLVTRTAVLAGTALYRGLGYRVLNRTRRMFGSMLPHAVSSGVTPSQDSTRKLAS
ncbi:UDP-N-acetylgalactosamine-undecaprenyl-phosphate N-acetylgalactosaminephosphotransferase [Maioricimonas rarisocia]|uniref:UDP-N-acetylgalactosamine-undecaprenyl-phosphate N-acetylgalactosaminephosphotransferase n=1 Tax=Maioricimonas rarisocia TaxID=2528026 RepID=A0A517ZD99_9PLAN|nr:sugar transferase [Maioricimonas rarisocia]QDU40420.1 UDP-N-acetylgalactosamine-undecaprenyl-phosphate N-acetylgalactosaminephosphotransferase [Maioricimonas rarisocia]